MTAILSLLEQRHTSLWQAVVLIALSLVAFRILSGVATAIYNLFFHPLRRIPGPPLWIAFPIIKTLARTTGKVDFLIRGYHNKYGEVIRTGPDELSFIRPDAWKDIYGHGHKEFPKHYPGGVRMDPKRIVSSNASDHFRFRRAMLPAFSDKALMQQESLIRVYVDLLVEKLHEVAKNTGSADMVHWYNLTTFDLIADLAYGKPLQGLADGKSNGWINNIANMMKLMPILVVVGTSPVLGYAWKLLAPSKIAESHREHMANVTRMANDRIYRHKQADRGDFMDYIMRSRGQAHELKDDELISNADLFMVAGSETTATLLSGATYWLLRTPSALRRATDEVRQAFASSDDINFTEVRVKLPYMIACLDEALRLFPPVPLGLQRRVPDGPPMHVAGLNVPEKTLVSVHQLSIMHSTRNFHRADEFVPDRWLQENLKDESSPFHNDRRDAYRPFSYGPRDCIGRNLASHEMRLILAKVLWNFDLSLDETCRHWIDQKIYALWSKPPLIAHIRSAIALTRDAFESNLSNVPNSEIMSSEEPPNGDAASDISSIITPSASGGTPTVSDETDESFTGLLPGNTYMILERESLRAVTLTEEGIRLKEIHDGQTGNSRWLCVERNGWLGLQEPRSGRYLGHNGKCSVQATATEFHAWECITTRDRPGGVYQLLVPHWWETLRTVVVDEDGESLITRQHGETLWRFLKVSGT